MVSRLRPLATLCALVFALAPFGARAISLSGDGSIIRHRSGPIVPVAPPPPPLKPELPAGGAVGYDISWPQCPDLRPGGELTFAIIGVTGGKVFTENRCLREEFAWANSGALAAQVYTNLNGLPSHYLHAECQPGDASCNGYHYGREAILHALNYARSQGVDARWWWLDIELENWWSQDKRLNATIIMGAIDTLRAAGKQIGVYSTPIQWNDIAGDFAPHLPAWTAGARNLDDARSRCNNPAFAFGGGQVRYVQYIANDFDTNLAC